LIAYDWPIIDGREPQMNAVTNMTPQYSISDLAKEFDLTTRAIRFYEDRALLDPERQGTKRLYSRKDRAWVKLIVRGKKLGFSLAEIHDLIELYENAADEVPQLERYYDKLSEHRRKLESQRQEIEQTIIELRVAEHECLATLRSKGIDRERS